MISLLRTRRYGTGGLQELVLKPMKHHGSGVFQAVIFSTMYPLMEDTDLQHTVMGSSSETFPQRIPRRSSMTTQSSQYHQIQAHGLPLKQGN